MVTFGFGTSDYTLVTKPNGTRGTASWIRIYSPKYGDTVSTDDGSMIFITPPWLEIYPVQTFRTYSILINLIIRMIITFLTTTIIL